MKVLQIISAYPPAYAYGGPTMVACEISQELASRGHQVTVCATDALDARTRHRPASRPEYLAGIPVYRFKNLSNRLAFRHNLPVAPGLVPFLRSHAGDFDVVHLHEYRSAQAYAAQHYCRKYGVPYVLHTHGHLPTASKSLRKRVFDLLLGEPILRHASALIATSDREARQYHQAFPDLRQRIVKLPNGLDLGPFRQLPAAGEFRRSWSIGQDEQVILFLGRLHEIKGADLLLRAYQRLAEEQPGLRLVIAGPDAGFQAKLIALSKELHLAADPIFPGPLYGRDKLSAYVDADIFALPSRSENFGNTVLEAMACGKPVLVTSSCGVSEYLAGGAGCVADCSAEGLYRGLSKLALDASARRVMGRKAAEDVRQFAWPGIIRDLEALYLSVQPGKNPEARPNR